MEVYILMCKLHLLSYVTCAKGACSEHLISLLPPKQRREGGISQSTIAIMHLHHKGRATNGDRNISTPIYQDLWYMVTTQMIRSQQYC